MSTDNLPRIVVFARVVDTGSFSEAARSLGVAKSVVSRHVQQLEKTLAVKLLNRTTRSLTLTEEGRLVYEHCARILSEAEALDLAVSRIKNEPMGILRVGTSVAFGNLQLTGLVLEFMKHYPKVNVQLGLNDRYTNLVEEGLDLAVRLGTSSDTGIVAKRLCSLEYVLCASPRYLRRRGQPAALADLAAHSCLTYSYLGNKTVWSFRRSGEITTVPVMGTFMVNSSEALREAVLAGVGVALLPTFVVGRDLDQGVLKRLLPEYSAVGQFGDALYVVYLQNRFLTPKVRAFIDFLIEKLAPIGPWDVTGHPSCRRSAASASTARPPASSPRI